MATYRELTYMVLDQLKEVADDAFYTEEHVLFLLGRMRALLLKRKYLADKEKVPESNYQEICMTLTPTDLLEDACGGEGWLRTVEKVPAIMEGIGSAHAYPVNFMNSEYFTFVPMARLPYVGRNKWLKNIIYCARNSNGYMYVNSANPDFRYLRQMKLYGVFEDAEKAAELQCESTDAEGNACDVLDKDFPFEESMVPMLIEMVIQELTGSRYAPLDKHNNASDDLSEIAMNAVQQAAQRTLRGYTTPVNPASKE